MYEYYYYRLKNQIKSRMTVLLNEESQFRSHTNTKQSVGIGSDSRLGESVIEARGGRGRDFVAEADLVFATTAGIVSTIKLLIFWAHLSSLCLPKCCLYMYMCVCLYMFVN